MATARLINPEEVQDGTAWVFDTYPLREPPFDGPPDRDWSDFRVTDEGAEFNWRTGADRVRECARRVEAGKLTMEQAMADEDVQVWLEHKGDDLYEVLLEEDPALKDLESDVQNARVFEAFASTVSNSDWYLEDDDAYLADAALALELPPWAKVWTHDDGGPGTGYTAAAIVLAGERTLEDLATWLREREAHLP